MEVAIVGVVVCVFVRVFVCVCVCVARVCVGVCLVLLSSEHVRFARVCSLRICMSI